MHHEFYNLDPVLEGMDLGIVGNAEVITPEIYQSVVVTLDFEEEEEGEVIFDVSPGSWYIFLA